MNEAYKKLLEDKIVLAEKHGIDVPRETFHPSLRPDQIDIAIWLLSIGAGLCAPDAGSGKTRIGCEVGRIIQQRFGGVFLIVTELGAMDTFIDKDPEVGEGVNLGLDLQYFTNGKDALASGLPIVCTNYERIRDGHWDFSQFIGVWLDEGNYLKTMASQTTGQLIDQLRAVKWKWVATATPSPNEHLELINYAHALGICDRGQILTRFFQRDSTKAGELTIHEHHVADFWLWVSSWCIATTSPADLGYEYEGFVLPKLNLHWVEVPMGKPVAGGVDRNGQMQLVANQNTSMSARSAVRRESIDVRVAKALEIVEQHPDDHFILWHHLELERLALNKAFKEKDRYACNYGAMKDDERERNVVWFTKGELKYLATKPELNGVGCNFQKHCNKAIFVAVNDSFNDWYQAIKRIWRFYNPNDEVDIWVLYTPEQYDTVRNLRRKWAEHIEMRDQLQAIIKECGLSQTKQIEERRRTFMVDRQEWHGKAFTYVNNDAVVEWANVPENSIDFINSSYPFGNHYEYTNFYNDFGHNIDNKSFIRQLDHLLPSLYRALKPGRIHTVHLKNRIHYGKVTGLGFSIFHRFTHLVCDAMEKHGFQTMGFHYIPTDVVSENNQTYRLGYGEMQKDATKMGSGVPEEIWVFRKPPTSSANAYADEPVKHNQITCPCCGHKDGTVAFMPWLSEFDESEEVGIMASCPGCKQFVHPQDLIGILSANYTLAQWQIDASAFWHTSGNRLLTLEELRGWDIDRLRKQWWHKLNTETIYDYEGHLEVLKYFEQHGRLSKKWETLPMRSRTPYIWQDVNRMHGLNLEQARRKQQNHICPQPFDEVQRVIELYTNPGDLVGDPFGGLGTTSYIAVKMGRRAFSTELNPVYCKAAVHYLKQIEMKAAIPTLFDVVVKEEQAAA
jgi:DNA modification methylase